MNLDERYRVARVEEIDSPALLVFPEIVGKNIDRALALTATPQGHCLRPHIKTVKCLEVPRMAIERGITSFKCSTVSEGELLGMAGAQEVLLNYQLSATKARRWAAIREAYPETAFAGIVDNVVSAGLASEVFADRPLDVYLDLNVGMDRTGIAPSATPNLLREVLKLPGLRLRGLHVYDGHLHDPDPVVRKWEAEVAYNRVVELRKELERLAGRPLEIVMGGSPTFAYYVGKPNTTVSPGTFYFWDAGYATAFPELPFEPAAVLLTRVLSVVNEHIICLDLGSKATAADPQQPRVVIPTIAEYDIIGQHEEHLNLTVPDSSVHKVGDVHFAVSKHICPTVNAYAELIPIVDGKAGKPWRVLARDRRINY